jgi:hypothetical protein
MHHTAALLLRYTLLLHATEPLVVLVVFQACHDSQSLQNTSVRCFNTGSDSAYRLTNVCTCTDCARYAKQQEPYNGGIKFSAMPPGKRLRDMDQVRTSIFHSFFSYTRQIVDA